MPRRREGKEINGGVRLLNVVGGLSHRGGTWALFLLKRPAAVRKKLFSDLALWT